MNEKKQKFFNNLAYRWNELHYKDGETNHRLDEMVYRFGIDRGSRILDLGCGTGVISERLLNLTGEKGRVYGCDFSLKMIEVAKKKTRSVIFVCADAHRLPFRDNFFDNVICFSCFPHFENKQNFLKEVNRVLKKEGMLVVSHLLGSKEINRIHRRIKGPVHKDKMPSKKWIMTNLVSNNFKTLEFIDKHDFFLFRARKIEKLPLEQKYIVNMTLPEATLS